MPLVFCVKYKYRALCGDITERGIEVIREVCAVNYVDLINVNLDHVYILISVPPHLSEYIKGKSNRKLQGEFQKLKNGIGDNILGQGDILSQRLGR